MKITEEETGSNPYCSAAAAGAPGNQGPSCPPAVLQQRGLTVKRKTKKQRNNFNINRKVIHSETPSESHKLQRTQVDKST